MYKLIVLVCLLFAPAVLSAVKQQAMDYASIIIQTFVSVGCFGASPFIWFFSVSVLPLVRRVYVWWLQKLVFEGREFYECFFCGDRTDCTWGDFVPKYNILTAIAFWFFCLALSRVIVKVFNVVSAACMRPLYGVKRMSPGSLREVYEAADYCYVNEQLHAKVYINDKLVLIKIHPLMAGFFQPRRGKEMAMPESPMADKEFGEGVMSLWVGTMFVGCAFRVTIGRRTFLATANHVFRHVVAGMKDARIGYRNHLSAFPLPKIHMRGAGDLMDFVLLEDSAWLFHSMGAKPLKSTLFKSGAVCTRGTEDGVKWQEAYGTAERRAVAFGIKHYSSTNRGWSGSPILDQAGAVMGIHHGSEETHNYGFAFVDCYQSFVRKFKFVRKESFEEFEHSEWHEEQRELELERQAEREAEILEHLEDKYRLRYHNDEFDWADEVEEEERRRHDDELEARRDEEEREQSRESPLNGSGLASGKVPEQSSMSLAQAKIAQAEARIQAEKDRILKLESQRVQKVKDLTARFNKKFPNTVNYDSRERRYPARVILSDVYGNPVKGACAIPPVFHDDLSTLFNNKKTLPYSGPAVPALSEHFSKPEATRSINRMSLEYREMDMQLKISRQNHLRLLPVMKKMAMLEKRVLEQSAMLDNPVTASEAPKPKFATPNPFDALSQSLKVSNGQTVPEMDFAEASDSTVRSSPVPPQPRQRPTKSNAPSAPRRTKSASQRMNSYGRTMEEKITFLTAGTHRVIHWRPGQEREYARWEHNAQVSPPRFEEEYRKALNVWNARRQNRRQENALMHVSTSSSTAPSTAIPLPPVPTNLPAARPNYSPRYYDWEKKAWTSQKSSATSPLGNYEEESLC